MSDTLLSEAREVLESCERRFTNARLALIEKGYSFSEANEALLKVIEERPASLETIKIRLLGRARETWQAHETFLARTELTGVLPCSLPEKREALYEMVEEGLLEVRCREGVIEYRLPSSS
jgi:hypothetical protein